MSSPGNVLCFSIILQTFPRQNGSKAAELCHGNRATRAHALNPCVALSRGLAITVTSGILLLDLFSRLSARPTVAETLAPVAPFAIHWLT